MKTAEIKRFLMYSFRWQLSTPILAPVIAFFKHSPSLFGTTEDWIGSAVANVIGASIFFWVDKFIFAAKIQEWEFMKIGKCADCGKIAPVKRLRFDPRGYDKREDPDPEFRCNACSQAKLEKVMEKIA